MKRTKTFGGVPQKAEKVDINYLLELKANFQKKTTSPISKMEETKTKQEPEDKNIYEGVEEHQSLTKTPEVDDRAASEASEKSKTQEEATLFSCNINSPSSPNKKAPSEGQQPSKVPHVPTSYGLSHEKNVSTAPAALTKSKSLSLKANTKGTLKTLSISKSNPTSPLKEYSKSQDPQNGGDEVVSPFYGIKLRKVSKNSKTEEKSGKTDANQEIPDKDGQVHKYEDNAASMKDTHNIVPVLRKVTSENFKNKTNAENTDEEKLHTVNQTPKHEENVQAKPHQIKLRKVSSNSKREETETSKETSPTKAKRTFKASHNSTSTSVTMASPQVIETATNLKPLSTPKIRSASAKDTNLPKPDKLAPGQENHDAKKFPSWVSLARRHTERYKHDNAQQNEDIAKVRTVTLFISKS